MFAKIHIPVPPLYLLRLQRSGGMEWDGSVGFLKNEQEKSGIEVLPLLPPFYPGGISFAVDWNDTKELVAKTKCKRCMLASFFCFMFYLVDQSELEELLAKVFCFTQYLLKHDD